MAKTIKTMPTIIVIMPALIWPYIHSIKKAIQQTVKVKIKAMLFVFSPIVENSQAFFGFEKFAAFPSLSLSVLVLPLASPFLLSSIIL